MNSMCMQNKLGVKFERILSKYAREAFFSELPVIQYHVADEAWYSYTHIGRICGFVTVEYPWLAYKIGEDSDCKNTREDERCFNE